jgi:transcriptional regulator with XRE-family HTH domain
MKIDSHKVKSLRLSKNWSQEQLSERCGLSLRTIQRIENGNNVSLESLKVLAMAFGIDPSELMIQEKQNPTTPVEVIKKSFMEFANFSGRATRYEYWWFLLFMVLTMAIATLIHEKLNQIVTILFLVPFLALGSRRLNDIGRSVWWQLFLFVPFGQVIVLYMMAEKTKNSESEQL